MKFGAFFEKMIQSVSLEQYIEWREGKKEINDVETIFKLGTEAGLGRLEIFRDIAKKKKNGSSRHD